MSFRVGFDVGGTFTDFVLHTEAGALHVGKRLTTYPDPSEACLQGLVELIKRAGLSWSDMIQAVHATTLGSNLVIERKADKVALLTTGGFRDVLIIGRGKRYQVYDLFLDKPAPLITRRMIREVSERILADGTIAKPLDEDETRQAIRDLAAAGANALAVCFLHSYTNPTHEKRVEALAREEAPQMSVSLSHEVSPTIREYERTSTVVTNAYVMTALQAYLRSLSSRMQGLGYKGQLYVMQSNGGIATADAMQRYPVRMIESGPTAGALMAAAYGKLTGYEDLIAFDMGGTTAKLALIDQGKPFTTNLFELHKVGFAEGSGLPMNIQALDLVEIGAGGGSIATVQRGVIEVGPESAGSDPGPVCYRRGGAAPTVTDANVILGYLNPDYFAGGAMTLDVKGAERAIAEQLATPLGLSVPEAAWGIHQVVTNNMELAARVVSIERGRDPRDLTLIAFGGSGPVHGCRLAQALSIPRVILPAAAGVTAALGLLVAEVKFDVMRSYVHKLSDLDPDTLNHMYGEMEQQALGVVQASTTGGGITVLRHADLRYVGQGYELEVPVPSGVLAAADIERCRTGFHQTYAARYGYASPDQPVEAVNWKLTALGSGSKVSLPRVSQDVQDLGAARKDPRRAYFPEVSGYVSCAVYDRYRLCAGASITGPAIIEERESTTVLPPGCQAEVDAYANLIVTTRT